MFPQPFGRYQLTERLALGGMAELFLGTVEGSHGFAKTVVIKRILPHLAADAQFTSMFITEAKITARLAHPKIAQTFELGTQGEQLFIVMEYVDGLDVLTILRECARRQVRIPAEVSVYIVKEVLDALDFAHKLTDETGESLHIVHRDVSPSNILLSKRGDVKLIDFGIAHAAEQDIATQAGTLKGKYGYMSPEQVLGQPVTWKSDIFSAAIVLSELVMGRRLFAAPNELDVLLMVRDVNLERLEQFGSHIDPQLGSLLRWALRKDPQDRYEDASVFRDALDEWLFEKRHRIGTGDLARIVQSLYDSAYERRKQSLAGMTPAVDDEGSIEGVPTGLLTRETSPDDEPSMVIEVSTEEESALDNIEDIEEDIDLGDEDLLSLDEVPNKSEDSTPKDPAAAILSFELDESPAETQIPAEDGSYRTISEAVASVAKQPRDPSTLDFNDPSVAVRIPRSPAKQSKRTTEGAGARSSTSVELSKKPDETGSLGERSALGALYGLTARRDTGLISMRSGGVQKELYMKRGVPVYVSSNVASELFGAYLVRQEVITASELDMALAVMPHFDGKLGDTLVGLGLIKPLEVFRHLTRQVRDKIVDVCTWTKGTYEWYQGSENPSGAFPLDLDPLEVYGAGALATPADHIREWLRQHEAMKPMAIRSPVVVPELFQIQGIRTWQRQLDGTRTISQILSDTEKQEKPKQFLSVLFLLVNTGLVADQG